MYPVDNRFYDIIGFSQESIMEWGFRSYSEEFSVWIVTLNDARDFCKAIGADPVIADI